MASNYDLANYYFGLPLIGAVEPQTPSAWLGQVQWLTKILVGAGIPVKLLPYALAQVYYESRNLQSDSAQTDNNFSGITFINKPYQVATRSKKYPKFAAYSSPESWAKDYKRVLSIRGKNGAPIDAQNAQQFYNSLLGNGYFTKEEAGQYSVGFNSKLRKINEVLSYGQQQSAQGQQAWKNGGTVNTGDWNLSDTLAVQSQQAKAWIMDNKALLAAGTGLTLLLLIATKRR